MSNYLSRMAMLIGLCGAMVATPGLAQSDDARRGTLRAEFDGQVVDLPLMEMDIAADIQGDLATVNVRQVFANPTDTPLNATYLFPLNKDAAVYAMTMEVGDERIRAQIKQSEEARNTFEAARDEGRAAALLTQNRPNMFTQEVANLMPGMPVTVTLEYVQTVPRIDGAYELVTPLIVGPRFDPPAAPQAEAMAVSHAITPDDDMDVPAERSSRPLGEWEIAPPPEYPEVFGLTLPREIDHDRVSISISLNAGMPIGSITSDSHAIKVDGVDSHRSISLAEGRVIDNRDFVLRYQLASDAVTAGILTHADERGGFASILIEPPQEIESVEIAAREIVFVLDTSGSMDGAPINASKAFMREALKTLRSGDYFRLIQFDHSPQEFSAGPVLATRENISAAQRYVAGLSAGGGTMVAPAMNQAFLTPQQPGTLRIVVFLSDGYVGNESEIFGLIADHIEDARLYAFGVGTAPNRYLMNEMARHGRGFARYVDPTETSHTVAKDLAQRIAAPLLTNITVDWGEAGGRGATPARIPDLFAGDSVRVMARFDQPGDHVVTVNGKVNGRRASMPVEVNIPDFNDPAGSSSDEGAAIPLIWARSQIEDAMRDYQTDVRWRFSGLSNHQLRKRVTELGLTYSLMTQWTSFVAVSEAVINTAPQTHANANVPLPVVDGVSELAYPKAVHSPRTLGANAAPSGPSVSAPVFAGSSTPEPGVWAMLALLASLGAMVLFRHVGGLRSH